MNNPDPLRSALENIAAFLLARDENDTVAPVSKSLMDWGRVIIASGKDAVHSGDCTKESHSCARCLVDRTLQHAAQLISYAALASPQGREAGSVAEWMIENGYVTGHGDTLNDLLQELVTQAQQAALKSSAPDAWLPIETAPRDGTRILLSYPHQPHGKRTWGNVRIGKWQSSCWYLDMSGNYRSDCTHWQPLPEPPAEKI